MNSAFSEKILADKLSKLESTQQCIETLSHWCMLHSQKAEQVVQTWHKQFHSSEKEHKIAFLYLANDILQNSRRNGNEFIDEFWKVLPGALKDVLEHGDDHGKTVVSRLVSIWQERKVFGSRDRGLNELMLGNEPLPVFELNKKYSHSVRILKRDSRSIKMKLSVGGTAEKIVSAFHSVLSEHSDQDTYSKKCKDAVHRIGKMEKYVAVACSYAGNPSDPVRATLMEKLQGEEILLKELVEKLKESEGCRDTLVSHLKNALKQQESDLENARTQLQVAQAQMEETANMKRRLSNEPTIPSPDPLVLPLQSISKTPKHDGFKKTTAAIAAEVADKLTASTLSQQIMTSVLSSLAAEEAKNAALTSSNTPRSDSETTEKRLKLEKPIPVSNTGFTATQSISSTTPQQYQTMLIQQPSMQTSVPLQRPQYNLSPARQNFQPTGGGGVIMGVPYTYSGIPPLPPLQLQMISLARPAQMATQQQTMGLIEQPSSTPIVLQQPMAINQRPVQLNLQQSVPPGYRPLRPPEMSFYQRQPQ